MSVCSYLPGTVRRVRICAAPLIAACALVLAAGLPGQARADQGGGALSAAQRLVLHGIAADTWKFYAADVDPNTNLPLDNLGPGAVRGTYTSAADIGVYLWAVVAARDLGLIDRARADSLISATLDEVATLKRYDGFLYQWYDTNNGPTGRTWPSSSASGCGRCHRRPARSSSATPPGPPRGTARFPARSA